MSCSPNEKKRGRGRPRGTTKNVETVVIGSDDEAQTDATGALGPAAATGAPVAIADPDPAGPAAATGAPVAITGGDDEDEEEEEDDEEDDEEEEEDDDEEDDDDEDEVDDEDEEEEVDDDDEDEVDDEEVKKDGEGKWETDEDKTMCIKVYCAELVFKRNKCIAYLNRINTRLDKQSERLFEHAEKLDNDKKLLKSGADVSAAKAATVALKKVVKNYEKAMRKSTEKAE
jgi:cobalamin biosynthesis protein CobT